MNQGLIPRRYAKALFKLALERGSQVRLYTLMSALVDNMAAAPAIQQVMNNPFISPADKTEILTTASGAKADDTIFADFLKLLFKNNRINMIYAMALAYCDIYRKENRIHQVTVVSAAPLQKAEEDRLRKMIESRLGGDKMEYEAKVDPSLIGGFAVNIDNERLDASVASELEQLRHSLIS